MSDVCVIDANRNPLHPVHVGHVRVLLTQNKTAVLRHFPFPILLHDAPAHTARPAVRVKIDPGSRTSGLAIVNDETGHLLFALEGSQRGEAITRALQRRRAGRRGREQQHTCVRFPGWLAPSLVRRVVHLLTWVRRLRRVCPVTAVSLKVGSFDLPRLENPESSGLEYQHRTRCGSEIRQDLLEHWGRACQYCGGTQRPLQIDDMHTKARGGSDRVSHLTLVCAACTQATGTQDLRVLLARLLAQAKAPLTGAAAVNSTRWTVSDQLMCGGLSAFNRRQRHLPKRHGIDVACVGTSTPPDLQIAGVRPLVVTATGHGIRQACHVNQHSFPYSKSKGAKTVKGDTTGDLVRAVVSPPARLTSTRHTVGCRESVIGSVPPIHRCDGFSYTIGVGDADQPSPHDRRRNASCLPCLKVGASWRDFGDRRGA